MAAPPLPSLLAYLLNDQTIRGFTGGNECLKDARIRGIVVPDTYDDQPMEFSSEIKEGPTILVMHAGGVHTEGYAPLISPRFFIRCYGVMPEKHSDKKKDERNQARIAGLLDAQVFRVLQTGGKKRFMGNTILSSQCETYGQPERDPETDWIFFVSTYSVEMSSHISRSACD